MEIVTQIFTTYNYSNFSFLEGNREVNAIHVKRLSESFKQEYLISPIIVNDKFQIIDGQHRFTAAKSLGLPVYYFICPNYSTRQIQRLNSNGRVFTNLDALHGYCQLGYPQYLKFRNFMNMFPKFNFSSVQAILTNDLGGVNKRVTSIKVASESNKTGSYRLKCFKEGKLNIPDFEQSIQNGKKIMQLKKYYDGYSRSTFVITMLGLFKLPHYDHDKLLQKLDNNPTALKHCVSVSQYKELLENIYNYKSREKVSLRF